MYNMRQQGERVRELFLYIYVPGLLINLCFTMLAIHYTIICEGVAVEGRGKNSLQLIRVELVLL